MSLTLWNLAASALNDTAGSGEPMIPPIPSMRGGVVARPVLPSKPQLVFKSALGQIASGDAMTAQGASIAHCAPGDSNSRVLLFVNGREVRMTSTYLHRTVNPSRAPLESPVLRRGDVVICFAPLVTEPVPGFLSDQLAGERVSVKITKGALFFRTRKGLAQQDNVSLGLLSGETAIVSAEVIADDFSKLTVKCTGECPDDLSMSALENSPNQGLLSARWRPDHEREGAMRRFQLILTTEGATAIYNVSQTIEDRRPKPLLKLSGAEPATYPEKALEGSFLYLEGGKSTAAGATIEVVQVSDNCNSEEFSFSQQEDDKFKVEFTPAAGIIPVGSKQISCIVTVKALLANGLRTEALTVPISVFNRPPRVLSVVVGDPVREMLISNIDQSRKNHLADAQRNLIGRNFLGNQLRCDAIVVDDDGDLEFGARLSYAWYKGSERFAGEQGPVIPAAMEIAVGDIIRCQVVVADGRGLAASAFSAAVQIIAPPTIVKASRIEVLPAKQESGLSFEHDATIKCIPDVVVGEDGARVVVELVREVPELSITPMVIAESIELKGPAFEIDAQPLVGMNVSCRVAVVLAGRVEQVAVSARKEQLREKLPPAMVELRNAKGMKVSSGYMDKDERISCSAGFGPRQTPVSPKGRFVISDLTVKSTADSWKTRTNSKADKSQSFAQRTATEVTGNELLNGREEEVSLRCHFSVQDRMNAQRQETAGDAVVLLNRKRPLERELLRLLRRTP